MSNSSGKPDKKLKRQGEDLVHFATKIYHFRKDVLKPGEVTELQEGRNTMQERLKEGRELKPAIHRLSEICNKLGGKVYPRNFWNENVEMFLGAIIVVLALRVFFAQPFIIPTNSMYPSFNGLTYEIYEPDSQGPGLPEKLFNLVTQGARHRSATAPSSGEIFVPVYTERETRPPQAGIIKFEYVRSRIFGVWPGTVKECTLLVGPAQNPVTFQVPRDFNLDQLIIDAFFGGEQENLSAQWMRNRGRTPLRTGQRVEAGDPVIQFDILLGDMLLVDRMSYHFVRPDIGDPFVFKTVNIPGLRASDGTPEDKYYIKRLVGMGGDTLEIRPPVLFRNGEPISGAQAFEKNANLEGEYEGYINTSQILDIGGGLRPGASVNLPEGTYYAMGDNSDQSLDSRSWGFVPEKSVIGRAIFIYYPFSSRWGPAK